MSAAPSSNSTSPLRLLHLAENDLVVKLFTPPFLRELQKIGKLSLLPHAHSLPAETVLEHCQSADVVLTGWGSVQLPASLAVAPGRLRYICHLTGTLKGYVPPALLSSPIIVTNWGDSPALDVAESALTLLLACLKILPAHLLTRRAGRWWPEERLQTGTLRQLRVGLYGYGGIGRRFHDLLRAFEPEVSYFDPFATNVPGDARKVPTLDALFAENEAICIHAALTPATRSSVNAERLAKLLDHGIIVNTARGDIIDQPALFRELASGRLRAALDVLAEPDTLPENHPARQWPNLLLTGHQLSSNYWPDPERLQAHHFVALDNLRRFASGQSLQYRITPQIYALST